MENIILGMNVSLLIHIRGLYIKRSISLSRENERNRKFLDEIGKDLGVKTWKEWYDIEPQKIYDLGGKTLLRLNNNSLYTTLCVAYPECEWKIWRFSSELNRVRNLLLQVDLEMHVEIFDDLMNELNITCLEDWYKVREDIGSHFSKELLRKYYNNSLSNALPRLYPAQDWKPWKFFRVSEGNQFRKY